MLALAFTVFLAAVSATMSRVAAEGTAAGARGLRRKRTRKRVSNPAQELPMPPAAYNWKDPQHKIDRVNALIAWAEGQVGVNQGHAGGGSASASLIDMNDRMLTTTKARISPGASKKQADEYLRLWRMRRKHLVEVDELQRDQATRERDAKARDLLKKDRQAMADSVLGPTLDQVSFMEVGDAATKNTGARSGKIFSAISKAASKTKSNGATAISVCFKLPLLYYIYCI